MLAHMRFVYGKTTMRLSGVAVRISSAEYAVRDQACGFVAATVAKRDHSGPRVPSRLVVSFVAVTTLVLAVAGGVMWGHRSQSSAATVPPIRPATVPTGAEDWAAVVRHLAAVRARALALTDSALLDQVYVGGSAAQLADRSLVRGLVTRGLRPSGLVISTLHVAPIAVTASQATLRVTDMLSAYELVGADGRIVRQVAGRPPREFTMLLVRVGAGWRIAAIHP